jgi:ATP-dependent exoDNAse (exonuclease V) beta subunit
MDFVDQETRVLKMAQTNDAFQSSMKDRIQILMVDEFQDTSPIQLALFFELAKIAISAVWVGDPKQAIYAFRGTDPQLMDDVVALFGNSQILGYSWRSKEKLLEFTNALFGQVFYETKAEKVVLKVPPQRMEQAKGGSLETWCLCVKNNDQEALALAQGVNELIARVQNIKPGDIAVLCRTNNECARIAAALEDLGVRASVGQGQLMDTRECTLAIAALRYMNDSTDTIALATIIGCISGDSNWYTNLMVEPEKTKNNWSNNEAVSVLNKARENIKNLTPLEALEQAITGIDLPNLLKSWPNPAIAMRNLDILRSACNQYINLCASRRRAATVDGYIAHIRAGGIEQAKGIGENTVNILTYHGAKGLEWPWVILTDLNKPPKSEIFGVAVEAAKNFDPARPLAGRKLRYWPWPFGTQKKFEPLDAQIDSLPIKQELQDKAEREEQRLLYVGMTRAKDGLVLALRKTTSGSLKSTWLDTIKDPDGRPILGWDDLKNEKTLRVGGLKIAAEVYEYDAQIIQAATPIEEKQTLPDFPNETLSYPPARIAPSELFLSKDDCDSDAWEIFENFNTRIGIKGTPDMDVLGNAVHAYLAVDTANLPDDRKISIASEILSNWGMQFGVEAAELAAAGNNLIRFINEHYAAHKVFREWPVSMINEKGQIVQGFIDLLLETPNGFVIIDHKDYPGENVLERMKRYIPQLKAYRAMIEKAASRRVIDTFLHLPVSGMVLRLTSLK